MNFIVKRRYNMKNIYPIKNPHEFHYAIYSWKGVCKFCSSEVIYWSCSCGSRVVFNLRSHGGGDHRYSCMETKGKSPYKVDSTKIVEIRNIPFKRDGLKEIPNFNMRKIKLLLRKYGI